MDTVTETVASSLNSLNGHLPSVMEKLKPNTDRVKEMSRTGWAWIKEKSQDLKQGLQKMYENP